MENNPIQEFKQDIKEIVENQRWVKPQRRTKRFEGKRMLTPHDAQLAALHNKERLRHMYIAYGLLRGKTYEEIEQNAKEPYNERAVSKLMQEYAPEAVRVSA